MNELRVNSRWYNIYSGETVTIKRIYYGLVYYCKDTANITIEPLQAYTNFMKPEYIFTKTYKPLTPCLTN